MNQKVILHLDMDAFFASCEQAHDKTLKNKPVVVARNNDRSIIVAASYDARKYGIKAGTPIFEAKQLAYGELIIKEGNRDLYEEYSERIFNLIKEQFTYKVEVLGIDECFIDATNIWEKYGNVQNLCLAIQAAVYQETGLTCSIGASFTRLFSKMGSDMKKPNGITIITKENFKTLIWNKSIKDVIGVGSSSLEKMELLNVKTVNDFVKLDEKIIADSFGLSGQKMYQKLHGIKNDEIAYWETSVKSISKEKTFDKKNMAIEDIEEILFNLAEKVVLRMQKNNILAKTVTLSIKFYNQEINFDKKEHKKRRTYSETFNEYTDSLEKLYSRVKVILDDIYDGESISLIGIGVTNLIEKDKLVKQQSFENIII
ncbi:DNA polymerase IV [Mesoplasma florum W37]|uniref:DNA polymerase IV n=1 Tax=Mesoplasma florum TaxID=2151 RepID=A0AAD0MNB2_MESFO|nr:DNA polymerase IV [Mesoplasma florum]AGY41414.1 DNA polymerase IV [Mesoplasma florum W37]ATI73967.1 DNA polymerase IV [Mesoplasma florum]AVN59633.1 DNA polymerase IV [Mesoplasma florum]AVN65755.1 DNA polymerase IV [Mesoplasma florum]